jgi:hypothetical protein
MIALFRETYIRLFKDLPVTLVGDSWESLPAGVAIPPHWRRLPNLPYRDLCEMLQQHQFVLNPSPLFPTAVHERLFTTTRARSVVVTEQTPLHDACLGAGAYVGLAMAEPEKGVARLAQLLTDSASAEAMAQRGYQATMPYFSLESSAAAVVDTFEAWMASLWLAQP